MLGAFFWKVTLTTQFTWMDNSDMITQVLPWFQVQAKQWHAGIFPLWDPHHWGGQPLLAQNQPGALYPLNWLLFLLPMKDGHIAFKFMNYYFLAMHVTAAWAFYALCRSLTLSKFASVMGGFAFAAAGYMGVTTWPQMLNGAVWIPIVLLFWIRALDGTRPLANACLAGAALGISLLSGHHQIPLFGAMMAAGVAVFYVVNRRHMLPRQRTPIWMQAVVLLGILAAMAFLLSAVQTLPSSEYWRGGLRWVNAQDPVSWKDKVPYIAHRNLSFNPVSLLGIVIPWMHAGNNHPSYFGMTVVALAAFGSIARWDRLHVRAFFYLAIGAIIFALGSASVFHGVAYAALPLIEKARNASMAMYGFGLSTVVLAAFGFDAIRARSQTLLRPVRTARLMALSFSGLVYGAILLDHMLRTDGAFGHTYEAFAALACLLLAGLLLLWEKNLLSINKMAVGLLCLMAFEFGGMVGVDFPHRETGWKLYDQLAAHTDIAEFFTSQPKPFRIIVDGEVLPYNFGDWWGIDQVNGNAGVSRNVHHLFGHSTGFWLFGARYWVGKPPKDTYPNLVFTGKSGLPVYSDDRAFGRVWLADQARKVEPTNMGSAFAAPLPELQKTVLLTADTPAIAGCREEGAARLIRSDPMKVEVDTDAPCEKWLVLGDTFQPGWQARLGTGASLPILEAYGFLRTVVVPAGRHRVSFEYHPRSILYGSALTFLGVLGSMLAAFFAYRKAKVHI